MENQEQVKIKAKKAAWVVGITSFLGFSLIMFFPKVYAGELASLIILTYLFVMPLGILASFLIGLGVYFLFKNIIKETYAYKSLLIILIIVCYPLGVLMLTGLVRAVTKTKPYTNQIDTNRDGRIDKWIYSDNLDDKVEIDTDFDGKPDIRRYYKNGTLIREEEITNLDKK